MPVLVFSRPLCIVFVSLTLNDQVMGKDKVKSAEKKKSSKKATKARSQSIVEEEEVTPMDVPADDTTTEEEVGAFWRICRGAKGLVG